MYEGRNGWSQTCPLLGDPCEYSLIQWNLQIMKVLGQQVFCNDFRGLSTSCVSIYRNVSYHVLGQWTPRGTSLETLMADF